MKITIAGSLGNIGKPLTKKLTDAGHSVTVISSTADRRAEIENLGATAAIGSVIDAAFLRNAFSGADAVFAMTPPNLGGSNIIANTTLAGQALAAAINDSGVKRVVLLSSIGADLPKGTGPIAGLYNIEQLFNKLENAAVTFLRAGYFYINFYNDIPVIKGMNIMGGNFSADTKIPLVHPADIATAVVEELQKTQDGKSVRYIVSDVKTAADIATALGEAIGKRDLPWVQFTDEQSMQGMLQAGLPEEIAGLYIEMGTGLNNNTISQHFFESGSPVTGQIKLQDFAKEFAAKY